jgi:Tol biopolymer transport system component/DNA-binding winged helix-turn-helix (wHTH) protein
LALIQRELYEFGPFVMDSGQMLLLKSGEVVQLPPKALETLLALLQRDGEVVTKQQLMDAVWPASFVEEGNLTQNVFLLRRALGKTPEGEEYIHTLPKRGYRMGVPVVAKPGRNGWATTVEPDSGASEPPLGGEPANKAETTGSAAHTSYGAPTVTEAVRRARLLRPNLAFAAVAGLVLIVGLIVATRWRLEPRLPRVSGYSQLTHDGILKTGFVTAAAGPVGALVSDGSRVFFNEGGPANVPTLAQVSTAGGESSVIPTSLGIPQLLDISPDHSSLLVADFSVGASEGRLWSVPVPSGVPRSAAGLSAWDATWSFDGREIAYVHGQDLYRVHSDGSEMRKLVHLPGAGWRPRWSPDGRVIRLTLVDTRTGLQSLWEATADGSGLHPLLPGWNAPPSECCGSWTPDGQYFVFQATRDEKTEIWAIRDRRSLFDFADQSKQAPFQLTSGQLSSLSPAVSPDGKKLYVIGRQLRGEVQRWDEREKQWVRFLGGISAEFVEFSPDRQWIAYVSFPEACLWKSRVDGTERTQLTFPPFQIHEPHWSPDGNTIAFQAYGRGTQSRIYGISSDGGKPQPLTNAEHHELAPSWSPDGKSMAFSYAPFVERSSETLGVFILDLASREKRKIPGSDDFIAPNWSPDGRYLAVDSLRSQKIALYDFRTKLWTEAAPGYGLAQWSRDGKFLYYLQYGRDSGVMRMRMSDRKAERVADLAGVRQAGSMAGLVFGLAPDGAPIIVRDTGTEEIYSLDWQAN